MKFMEKAKRFFTLNAANHEGFTLVELIVVIAILAILAGVAVPAYSGYIKRAEKAGDLQIVGAINEAFAAACMVQNLDARQISSATLAWGGTDNKCVTGIAFASGNGVDATKLNGDFQMFWDTNKTAEFKALNETTVSYANGIFFDLSTNTGNGGVTVSYAGSSITVSADALLALKNSTFGDIGSNKLLNQVDDVTNFAAGMAGHLNNVFIDPDFIASGMAALGATTEDEYNAKTGAIVDKLIAQGMSPADAQNQVATNAAVLYASQHAANYTPEQINALFSGSSDQIKNNLLSVGNTADGMAQAALVYGMYTAYANQPGNEAKLDIVNDPLAVLGELDNDAAFRDYVNSDQGKTDLQAYQSALGVIVDSTKNNEAATTDLMINGFNNDELMNVIGGLMG